MHEPSEAVVRVFQVADLPRLKDITAEAFDGVSIDQNIERRFGAVAGHAWQWRKARHVEVDAQRDPQGIFVAEHEGRIVGYVSTWIDREAGIGHIPNLALTAAARGRGLGRRLLEHALARFRQAGIRFAKIETLDQNQVAQQLFPSLGFEEVARQIHYFMPLEEKSEQPAQRGAS
jgi:ribosomal protein S18 acetylase RimI-like enzyme